LHKPQKIVVGMLLTVVLFNPDRAGQRCSVRPQNRRKQLSNQMLRKEACRKDTEKDHTDYLTLPAFSSA
jgi:hypothetical protein